jgi:hypothetical protein
VGFCFYSKRFYYCNVIEAKKHYKRDYLLLGRLLVKHRPEIAASLISEQETRETDFAKIPKYLKQFCKYKGVKISDHINYRREFLSVMLHLYNPQVYNQPTDSIKLNKGFVLHVSIAVQQDNGNTSRMIREVISLEKIYENFRVEVAASLQFLTEKSY